MNGERRAEEILKAYYREEVAGEAARRAGGRTPAALVVGAAGSAGTVGVAGLEERRRKARAELRKPAAAAAACLALMAGAARFGRCPGGDAGGLVLVGRELARAADAGGLLAPLGGLEGIVGKNGGSR